MPTIASNLTSIGASKTKLKANLIRRGQDASAINNLDALVDLAFADDWSPDPAWPDIETWTPAGACGFVMSNFGYGYVSFFVTTVTGVQYTVVVNDGTNDISTTNYASGALATVSVTPGDGNTYYRVKITSAAAITRFYVARTSSPTLPCVLQNIPILYFYGNLSTLTSCANMFYVSAAAQCQLLQAWYISSTSSVATFSSMCRFCSRLVAIPAVLDTHASSTFASMFNTCNSLRRVPAVMNLSAATTVGSMFASCYSLRRVPEVMDLSKVATVNFSAVFSFCNALEALPAVLDLHAATTPTSLFNGCMSLASLPVTMDFTAATDFSSAFASLYRLKRTLLDLSMATGLTKCSTINNAQGLHGVIVSNVAPFSGTSPQIAITDCGLDRTALVALFNSLPTVTGKNLTITGCMGVPNLTGGDLAIATGKGWTVTT